MRVRWEISDGYVGKSRPHYTEIPDEEFDGLNEEEKEQLIDDWVEEEFNNKVSFYWKVV